MSLFTNELKYSMNDVSRFIEDIKKLEQENKKLRECRDILKDFLTTEECSRTWIDEMHCTIDSVLKELEG